MLQPVGDTTFHQAQREGGDWLLPASPDTRTGRHQRKLTGAWFKTTQQWQQLTQAVADLLAGEHFGCKKLADKLQGETGKALGGQTHRRLQKRV